MGIFSAVTAIRDFFRNIFKSRNIIVISDEAVNHYPVTPKFQLCILAAVAGFISWASYSTGSYIAAQSVLREKDETILEANMENKKMGHDFSLLKRDLMKLSEGSGELSDYSKFVLEQYSNNAPGADNSNLFSLGGQDEADKLLERLNFLEQQVSSLENQNEQIIQQVRERTGSLAQNFESIIGVTGLDVEKLKKQALQKVSRLEGHEEGGLGGPFIPAGRTSLSEDQQAMLQELSYLSAIGEVVSELPIRKPIHSASEMSGYGKRIDPFTRRWAVHQGIDLAAPHGAKIMATSAGTVTFAGRQGAYGNMVEIKHQHGLSTRYGHLSRITVQDGQKVKAGDTIGVQGSTGRSTGDHLHYEVRLNDRPINPHKFLKASRYVESND